MELIFFTLVNIVVTITVCEWYKEKILKELFEGFEDKCKKL